MKTPVSSGIITNYNCTASCRHCMFASSPECRKDYISRERAEQIALLLERAGTISVHIGGGEPFMDFDGLCGLITALNRHGIGIDYIETNGYWARDISFAERRLEVLKRLGVYTIMVSVDPYHIEYVPLEMPLKLIELLRAKGFDYFIWQQKFLKPLLSLDISKNHSKEELMSVLGEDYILNTAREYGLGINGRALSFARDLYPIKSAEEVSTDESCPSLTRPHHCHIDLYGNAIPSRCTGIQAKAEDYLTGNITEGEYPVLSRLIHGGVKELLEFAREKGFIPDEKGYATKCELCFAIRAFLEKNSPSADLGPSDFYVQMSR